MDFEKSAMFRLKKVSNLVQREILIQMKDKGELTGMSTAVLGYICMASKKGDVFQRDIEAEFNIRRSTATGFLQQLEKKGYIKRKNHPKDARIKKIAVTEKALDLQRETEDIFSSITEKMSKGLTEDELNGFFSVMEKMSANLRK